MFAANDPNLPVFAALSAPFEEGQVRIRNQGGQSLSYITARTAMNRLDDVVGGTNWWDEYVPLGDDAVICKLTIRFPDGTTVTKSDAGGYAKTHDPSDAEKSGLSDAFKRAAVKFGVGRYLYGEGVAPSIRAEMARQRKANREAAPVQSQQASQEREPGGDDDATVNYDAPPQHQQQRYPSAGPAKERPPVDRNYNGAPPKSGKALFAWAKEQDEKNGIGLLNLLADFGKMRHFPPRLIQWNEEQVAICHKEACEFMTGNGALAHAS